MLRNFTNFVISTFIIYSIVFFLPLFFNIYAAISIGWLGIKLAEWLMTITRTRILYKSVCPTDKAVLITGCDSGFGNELSRRMDDLGYKVYSCCLDPKGEGVKKLSSESSDRLIVLPMNVTDEKSIQEVKEFVARDLGQKCLWAVVNNAGITHWSEIDWTPVEEVEKIYNVNALGTLRVTKAFLPFLKKSRGRIVNVASISGRFHVPVFVGYCMSKSAVVALTTGLRIELAKWGIKTISIEPSFYSTPLTSVEAVLTTADKLWEKATDETKEEYGKEYMQSFKKCTREVLESCCNPNRSEVIACLEDAIVAEEPLSIYFPCSFSHRLFITSILNLPSTIHDLIQKRLLNVKVKPLKPHLH